VALLLVSVAGPQIVRREQVYITRGIDVVIALDQSPTMAARDFQPDNRFNAAKSVVRRFVEGRENDPIGLVGFGREASLRVPPTLDYRHLLAVLESMEVWELGDGTAIGMGLAVAALHLSGSSAPRKVIILLTDGVNNAGEILPETAAEAANAMGIQVYVVGIGSGDTVEFEAVNPETGERQRGTFPDGFDEQLLRSVATAGGGSYFYAGSSGALSSVFQAIDTVERVEQRSLLRVHKEHRYRGFAALGLALVLLDFLVRRLVAREVL
jgi:Ca-activated chloride channel family protein